MHYEGGIMKKIISLIIRKLSKIKNDERGSIVVIAAISFVMLLSVAALVIDIGLAYLEAGNLQKAADAAVYSAGKLLPVKVSDNDRINVIKDDAIHYAEVNGFNGLTRDNIILGNVIDGSYTYIKVEASEAVSTNFAKVMGINEINVTRTAAAKLSPTSKTTGASPLGILKSQLEEAIENNQVTSIVLKYGSADGVQGFFGALDLDGKQGGGAKDYKLWLSYGFPGEIAVGDILLEEHGNMMGATYEGFLAAYGGCTHYGAPEGVGCTYEHYDSSCPRIAKVVVYTDHTKSTVKVAGFAAFILESQVNGYITGSFLNTLTSGQGSGGDAGSASDYGLYTLMLSE